MLPIRYYYMIFGCTQHNSSKLGSALGNHKASFHCTHLSKTFQIFAAVHKSDVLKFAAKIKLSFLSPNLSAYWYFLLHHLINLSCLLEKGGKLEVGPRILLLQLNHSFV